MLVTSIFSFSHHVFKKPIPKGHENQGSFGKGLRCFTFKGGKNPSKYFLHRQGLFFIFLFQTSQWLSLSILFVNFAENSLFTQHCSISMCIFYSQAYCNVIAGACMVLGLKFAGTANQAAFNTLVSDLFCEKCITLTQTSNFRLSQTEGVCRLQFQ